MMRELLESFVEQRLTTKQMADQIRTSRATVRRRLNEYGLSTRYNPLRTRTQTDIKRRQNKKLKLVSLRGNKCDRCPYDKNLGALTFHHRLPENKKFELSMRSMGNHSWADILEEFEKCDLLCHNCHAEVHYPHLAMEELL